MAKPSQPSNLRRREPATAQKHALLVFQSAGTYGNVQRMRDIQTADMLKLPVPALVGGKPTNIQLKPSEIQKQMVAELGERADKIRNKW